MSTESVAIESEVYQKLVRERRIDETFTETLARLLLHQQEQTCAAAVQESAKLWGNVETADDEADRMEGRIAESRIATDWSVARPQ